MTYVPPAVRHLADRLDGLGSVTELPVAGSLATGDYVPGVSDLDALTGSPVSRARQEMLAGLHRELDRGAAHGLDLGCAYVDAGRLADLGATHPTWTHGSLVDRSLSGVTLKNAARCPDSVARSARPRIRAATNPRCCMSCPPATARRSCPSRRGTT